MVAAIDITGGQARYQPGAHYFATRLHDLDFASVGKTSKADADEELVHHPRGSGSISYRKLLLKAGKLVGAVMLGQRTERVRAHGRNYKRLVDEGVDVRSIKDQLLDARFDLKGWLKKAGLLEKPREVQIPTGQQAAVAAPAQIRGTQFFDFKGAVPGAPVTSAVAAVPPKPMPAEPQGKPLTIGLRAAEAPLALSPLKGYLDGGGQRWPLDKAVVSLGRAPQNQVVITDSSVSQVHAQITLYQAELYLRDLGSRNGTFVNGQKVVIPHRLRGGDRLKLGNSELVFSASG